jgi:hypothetical protein
MEFRPKIDERTVNYRRIIAEKQSRGSRAGSHQNDKKRRFSTLLHDCHFRVSLVEDSKLERAPRRMAGGVYGRKSSVVYAHFVNYIRIGIIILLL